jgi:hypothetical protein
MPSPFPGMDPYLEQPELWSDFHGNLAPEIQARLNGIIQPQYFARLTPYVTCEELLTLHRIEVCEVAMQQLVTVIEILSPVNKRPGHDAYVDDRRKRRDLLRSAVHLLEIDLLRGGERPPLQSPVQPAPYYVVLARADQRPNVDVWPVQLTDSLPLVPVPLLEPDPDAPLDLQAAFTAIYDRCAYASRSTTDSRHRRRACLAQKRSGWHPSCAPNQGS